MNLPPRSSLARALITALLFLPGFLHAADAELRGRVTDSITGFGISQAEVELVPDTPGATLTATADLFGFYQFPAIPAGSHTLGATATGYAPFSDTRAYAADELATEDIPLTPLFTGSSIDLQIQVTDTRTDVPLADVPVRIQQFATAGSTSALKTTVKTTNARGEIEFKHEPSGHYEFRVNSDSDGTKLTYYKTYTPPRTDDLEVDHVILAKLLPIDQSLTVAVTGVDPVDPETVPAFLKGATVEVMPVVPSFTIPVGFDPMTDDLRNFASPIQNPFSDVTDMTGGVVFGQLGPYGLIITVKKPGYLPKQVLLSPVPDGDLPATTTVPIDLVPGTGASITVSHPAYPESFLVGLPIKLEGIEGGPANGSATRGISRLVLAEATGTGVAVADFSGLLPGRYRASVDATTMSPPTPASESAVTTISTLFRGQIQFEVAEGLARMIVLEPSVVPAKVRGRFFKADDRADIDVKDFVGHPAPLDRWLGPAYQLSAQPGIEFVQSELAPYLPPGASVVGFEADALGNFELALLPGFYGIRIPPLDGYWGSHFRSLNRSTGETFNLGWPYAVDPAATGGIPAHPFGSLGIPISSGDDLEIDLYVRKQTYFLDGTILGDSDCPLLDLVIARTAADSLTYNFSHFAATGSVSYDEGDDGAPVTIPLTPGTSSSSGDENLPNINATFLIEAPPGSHKVTVVNPEYALPAGVFEIVGLPDYGFVGSGDAGTGDGIIPMENNWGQLAAAFGTLDPWISDYKGDHHLLIEFVEDDGMGGVDVVHTTTFPDFVENTDFPGRLFATGAGFEMFEGDWTIYVFYDGEWFKDTVSIGAGAPPTTHTLTFDIDFEFGDPPPTPAYDFTVESINAADPGTKVPNIKLEFAPPLGDAGPSFISTGTTGSYSTPASPGYTGGYIPLSIAPSTAGPDAVGIAKWTAENGINSPFTSYDLDIAVPGGAGRPTVALTSRFKRGSMVHGTVRAQTTFASESFTAPFEGVPVRLFDRYGNRFATLLTDASGDFATPAALPATPVLYVRIDVPGYIPYFARFTPNSGDDSGPDIDFDLSDPGIELTMIPQPDLIEMDELFDRAGPFIPGIRREPGEADELDPSLEMTWTATARSATKWDQSDRNFDTKSGAEDTGSTTKVLDPVTKFWIVNRRYFDGLQTAAGASLVSLPSEFDATSGDPDPLFNAKMRVRMRELEVLDTKVGHLIYRSGPSGPPVLTGSGDSEKATTTGSGTIALPDLPPGVFEVYVVTETRRGSFKYELYPGTTLGEAEKFQTLVGLELPSWLSAIADMSESYAESKKPGPPMPFEILPVQNLLRFDPSIEFAGTISDNPDGTLVYDYSLGSEFDVGARMPFSGLSSNSASLLAYAGAAGFRMNGDVMVELNGSRSTGTNLIGAPELSITGGAAFNNSASLGGPGLKGLIADAYKPAFLKPFGLSVGVGGEAAMQLSTSSAITVPFYPGDELGALDRRFTLAAAGVVEPMVGANLAAAYNLIPAPPPIGLFLSGLAGAGVLPNASLTVSPTVGMQLNRESTTRFGSEIPLIPKSVTDPSPLNPLSTSLGGQLVPLPEAKTQSSVGGKVYLGYQVDLRANTALSLNNFHGRYGTLGPPQRLPGSTRDHQFLTVSINSFDDRPALIRVFGEVGGELTADMRFFIVRFKKSLGSFSLPIDVSFNTEERFYVRPYSITDTMITPDTSPVPTWLGTSPQLVQDFYPLAKFSTTSEGSGSGGLAFAAPKAGGGMALQFAERGSSTSFGSLVEVASAPGILGVAVHPLPTGGWMAAWSEISAAGVMELAPSSTIRTSTSADGVTWSAPVTVASPSGTAFDLRLIPMPGSDLGLLWLESDRGPGQSTLDIEAALWDDSTTTWGPPQFLYDDIVVRNWDAAGPGFGGSVEAQIVVFTDVGGFVAAGWDGAATSATVGLDGSVADATECAITSGPDDTFTAVYEFDGGGIGAFRKTGAGAWTALPAITSFAGQTVGSLDVAATDDGSGTHTVIALASPDADNGIRTLWLDDLGALAAGPTDIHSNSTGHYRGLQITPLAGSHAAELVSLFEYEDEPEMRWFGISEASGVTAADRDGDTLDDIAELRIVDADPDDAIETIDDVLGADDFDSDASDNGTELAAGTDPIDPSSFPGQIVELDLTDTDAAEFGSDSGLLHILRSGEIGAPLTVTYVVTGSATADTDYPALSGTAEFAAGQSSVPLFVVPSPDSLAEGDETVIVTLDAGAGYTLGSTSAGTVTIADLPMDAWRFENFTPSELADLFLSGEDADFESDGSVNLLEFAFDSDPKSGLQTDQPVVGTVIHPTTSAEHLALVYLRRKDEAELSYQIQYSPDLSTWTNAGTGDVEEIGVVDNLDGTETVTVRDVLPLTGATKRFLRVVVTRVGG